MPATGFTVWGFGLCGKRKLAIVASGATAESGGVIEYAELRVFKIVGADG